LDTAAPKFSKPVAGAAKLLAVDLATDKVVKTIVLPPSTVLPTTYINDVRFEFIHTPPQMHIYSFSGGDLAGLS
jgi:hypothetical protein